MDLDRDKAAEIYRSMVRSRTLEEALIQALTAGKKTYVGHPASGQEGVAAGICAALRLDDHLYCGHRAKHWAIAKGAQLPPIAAEFWGKATGLAGGWGGEMHMMDRSCGFMGSNHIVAGVLPVAAGSALAARLRGEDRISVAVFGDGGSVQGTFHEALNLAATWHLPMLFVCENNQYAESTPVEYHSYPFEIYRKAQPFDMPTVRVDGQDALGVYEAARAMVDEIRRDGKPRFIEAVTYRYLGHFYGDNTARYRTAEEEAAWRARDPLAIFQEQAQARGLLADGDLAQIREQAAVDVAEAMEQAEAAPYPAPLDSDQSHYARAV